MTKAKVFWSGRSQAIRLPKEFRFDAKEVLIEREGDTVILKLPKKRDWPKGYWESFGELSSDFMLPEDAPPLAIKFDLDSH